MIETASNALKWEHRLHGEEKRKHWELDDEILWGLLVESAFHFTDYRKPVWFYKQGRDGINFITNDFKGNNIQF